jgi:hypothetical protein
VKKDGGFEDCWELAGDLRLTDACGDALLFELRRDMLEEVRVAGKEEKEVRRSTWPDELLILPFMGGRKGRTVDMVPADGGINGVQTRVRV